MLAGAQAGERSGHRDRAGDTQQERRVPPDERIRMREQRSQLALGQRQREPRPEEIDAVRRQVALPGRPSGVARVVERSGHAPSRQLDVGAQVATVDVVGVEHAPQGRPISDLSQRDHRRPCNLSIFVVEQETQTVGDTRLHSTQIANALEPEEARRLVSLSPDGHRVLIEKDNQLELYDLDTARSSWTTSVARPPGWQGAVVEWSRNGAFFVLGEQEYPASDAGLYSIWERATGRRVSPVYAIKGQWVMSQDGLAVSNDGRWFACNKSIKAVRIYDTRQNEPVLEIPIQDLSYLPLAFAADSAHFSLARQLFELRDGGWQPAAAFPDSLSNAWVGERLALVTRDAVQVWEHGHVTQQLPTRGPVELAAGEHLLAIIEAIDVSKAKYQDHLERLTLYDPEHGTKRFARDDLGSDLQIVFRGERLFVRVFRQVWDTFVLELDTNTGKTLAQAAFGEWGSGVQGAPSSFVSFYPLVLPQARYIELRARHDPQRGRFQKLVLE